VTESLLTTKLYVPQPVPGLVSRPHLSKQLDEGIRRKLTLISAPAGFGKTTLLSEWRMIHLGGEWPAGWVSLDEGDNDPVLFFSYLIAALRVVQADIGEAPLALLQSPQGPPLRSMLTILLNELAAIPKDFALVLDDYHVIENRSIHDAIAFLLDHMPPQMHLIISSRTDPPLPLARLRARNDLTELRPADLRFEPEEVATFLSGMVGFDLSADDVAALNERTEGWIAGLQLVALSLQGKRDIPNFINEFTGTHRHVFDYLAEEILHKQPQDVRDFLLRTAILHLLSSSLCDALTGRSDSQQMLEDLEHANLFLVPLDNQRRWYRYHHLFSDFLRERLRRTRPDLTPELHRTASEWYEHNGLMAEAVEHALAAEAFERAVRLVDRVAEGMLRQGRLTTLAGWMEALPERMVYVRTRPYLFHAETLFLLGRYEAAEANLQKVEHALNSNGGALIGLSDNLGEPPMSDQERTELRSMVAAIRASVASVYGDLPQTVTLSQQALRGLPEEALVWRGNTLAQLGVAYALNGDMEAASRTFAEAYAVNERADNAYAIQIITWRSARLQVAQGRLRRAADIYRKLLQQASEQMALGQLPVTGYCHLDLGDLLREWNDLGTAAHHLQEGIERIERAGSPTILLDGYIALARLRQALGDEEGALGAFQEAQWLVSRHNLPPRFIARLGAHQARLWLAQGNLEAPTRWAQDRKLDLGELSYLREAEHLAMVRVLIAQGKFEEAQQLLERLLTVAKDAGRARSVIESSILQALAFRAKGDEARALRALESALELAEPEGYVRTFLDEGAAMTKLLAHAREAYGQRRRTDPHWGHLGYVSKLLAAFEQSSAPRHMPPEVHTAVEPLSERELEVLQLVAAGLKNQEIAEELFVVVGTVKAHLNSIYRKLGVQSRIQAVSRAKELDLLDGDV
jgi:LuxR family transcriptional regulator, maltose regulon positive regulatory protein